MHDKLLRFIVFSLLGILMLRALILGWDGRVVEGACLECKYTLTGIQGSNPCPTAKNATTDFVGSAFLIYKQGMRSLSRACRRKSLSHRQYFYMSKKQPKIIVVNDSMQQGYAYELTAPTGRQFDAEFKPDLTPKEMLSLGVFGGHYLNDCQDEFPKSWFTNAKLSPEKHNDQINYYKVHASQSLQVWRNKGWINEEHDPRGWFQWYCRYYMGRRLPLEDARQIKRWKAIKRHVGQIKKNCRPRDLACRKKQRQALLHWAYDSRKL